MSRRAMRRQMNLKAPEKNNGALTENYEEYGSDNNYDANIVTDLAKGFAEAQASTVNNQEIISLLEKINSQLEMLKLQQGAYQNQQQEQETSAESNKSQTEQQSQQSQQQTGQQKENQQSDSDSQMDNQATQDLKNLFSQILMNSGNHKQQSQSNSNLKSQSPKQNDKTSALAVQTASQVLAKAQYELANELETSLQKLKQVISESEKIANQISNLLGESSNKKS